MQQETKFNGKEDNKDLVSHLEQRIKELEHENYVLKLKLAHPGKSVAVLNSGIGIVFDGEQ